MYKKTIVLIILLLVLGISCSSIAQEKSPADKVVKKASLPAPSSLVEDEETKLVLTAHELVKGISGNNIKQNIEEYFGKYAEITGIVKRVDAKTSGIDITLDGEIEGELVGVICRITSPSEILDSVKIGDILNIDGQIKALKEVPGNQVQDQLMIQSYAQLVKPCKIKIR